MWETCVLYPNARKTVSRVTLGLYITELNILYGISNTSSDFLVKYIIPTKYKLE